MRKPSPEDLKRSAEASISQLMKTLNLMKNDGMDYDQYLRLSDRLNEILEGAHNWAKAKNGAVK